MCAAILSRTVALSICRRAKAKSMRPIMCSVLLISLMTMSTPGVAAGFFEEVGRALFGSAKVAEAHTSKPLVVHVRKRAQGRAHANRARPAPKRPAPMPALHTPERVDPYVDRDWFLRDATIRNGDIVVTANGPLVMQAARQTGLTSDFISLTDARSVTQSEKHRLIDAIERGLQHRLTYTAPSHHNQAPDTGP